jgi:hypothetical protein
MSVDIHHRAEGDVTGLGGVSQLAPMQVVQPGKSF